MRDFDTLFPIIVLIVVPLLVIAWIKGRQARKHEADTRYDQPGDWSN